MDVADDRVRFGGELRVVLALLVEEAAVHAVAMGGDEIDRHVAGGDEGQELGHPRRTRGRWAADAELGVDRLDRARGVFVQPEIGRLVGLFPEAVEIGLVPDLEEPAAHLRLAVALLDVGDEGGDEAAPSLRLRVRGIAVPPEDLVVGRLQRLGREAQFDEGLDVTCEEVVIELVDGGPIVSDAPVWSLLHRAERVVENGVEAEVAKAELVDRGFELRLGIVAAHRAGIIGADRQIEEAV